MELQLLKTYWTNLKTGLSNWVILDSLIRTFVTIGACVLLSIIRLPMITKLLVKSQWNIGLGVCGIKLYILP